MIDPSICWIATNTVAIHDTYASKLYYYAFSGTTWSLTGSGTSVSGGYSSGIVQSGSYTSKALSH